MGLLSSLPLLVLLVTAVKCQASSGPIVETRFGKVQGIYTDNARIFKSIPYAGPVDGANRWKDSKFPEPWDGIFNATREGIGCPQNCDLPTPDLTCPSTLVENCLLLNIYTPLNEPKNLPVLVFIHGGEFIQGYGGTILFDGRYIINDGGIILVTINYRLGALANLAYGTGDNAINGNFAIKDQRLALEWVKMNIEYFGGNPNDVTISGQSAGGVSVAIHATSIKSAGLFHKAIIESYPFSAPLKSTIEAKLLGQDFAEELGCGKKDDYDCLYSKSITEVAKATSAVNSKIVNPSHLLEVFLQWTPVLDGVEVTGQPFTMFKKGEVANVPIMIGTTSQEAVLFIYRSFSKMNSIDYAELLLAFFPFHYETVNNLYHYSPNDEDKRDIASVVGTDEGFICPTRVAARSFSNHTLEVTPVYHYVFDHVWSFKQGWKPYSMYEACTNASCHGAELPFIFKTAELSKNLHYNSEELTLANEFMTFVSNFVRYGNPNFGKEIVEWPPYSAKTGWPTMILKTPQSQVVKDYRSLYCDKLDEIGYEV